MSTKGISHTVVLRHLETGEAYWKILRPICNEIDCGGNKVLLYLHCYEVSIENSQYAELIADNPKAHARLKVAIPHDLVLLITDTLYQQEEAEAAAAAESATGEVATSGDAQT